MQHYGGHPEWAQHLQYNARCTRTHTHRHTHTHAPIVFLDVIISKFFVVENGYEQTAHMRFITII